MVGGAERQDRAVADPNDPGKDPVHYLHHPLHCRAPPHERLDGKVRNYSKSLM